MGLAGLASGCELVAGIQDLSLTGSPDAEGPGASGASGASGTYGGSGSSGTSGDSMFDATAPSSDAGPGVLGDATLTDAIDTDSTIATNDATSPQEGGSNNVDGPSGEASVGRPDATVDSGSVTGSHDASTNQPDGADAGPLTLTLIDDMEGTSPSAGWLDGKHVTGTWFTFDDGTDGGVLTPAPNAGAATIIALLDTTHVTYNGIVSHHAATVATNDGFTSYGDGEGFNVNVLTGTLPQPYDASAYSGFVFWARSVNGAAGARFNVMDVNTTSPGSGGVCDGGVCNGFFGIDFGKGSWPALTTDWQMYVVPFDALTRPVWAASDLGLVFDPTQMIGCQFQLAEGTAGDIWVDDVYFINK